MSKRCPNGSANPVRLPRPQQKKWANKIVETCNYEPVWLCTIFQANMKVISPHTNQRGSVSGKNRSGVAF